MQNIKFKKIKKKGPLLTMLCCPCVSFGIRNVKCVHPKSIFQTPKISSGSTAHPVEEMVYVTRSELFGHWPVGSATLNVYQPDILHDGTQR